MRKTVSILILIGVVLLISIGYYLISPLFITVEVNEAVPQADHSADGIADDRVSDMSAEDKAAFDQAMNEMKDDIKEMDEPMPENPSTRATSAFLPDAHDVEGTARIINTAEGTVLRFENFETINGPNLHVYLASGLDANDFIDLGELKGTSGNFNYHLPDDIDLERYSNVLIWCVPFGVLFSHAELA